MATLSKFPNPKWDRTFNYAVLRRELCDLLRAILAHVLFGVPYRECAIRCNVRKSTLERGVAAYRAGRPFGVPGRPRYFTTSEEKEIEQKILERSDALDSMSRYELIDYVRHPTAVFDALFNA